MMLQAHNVNALDLYKNLLEIHATNSPLPVQLPLSQVCPPFLPSSSYLPFTHSQIACPPSNSVSSDSPLFSLVSVRTNSPLVSPFFAGSVPPSFLKDVIELGSLQKVAREDLHLDQDAVPVLVRLSLCDCLIFLLLPLLLTFQSSVFDEERKLNRYLIDFYLMVSSLPSPPLFLSLPLFSSPHVCRITPASERSAFAISSPLTKRGRN